MTIRAIEERDEAVADVGLSLETVVREHLESSPEWNSRYVSLDGVKTLRVETEANGLHILGAFYLLDEHGHRMLPVDAHLTLERGAISTVRLAGLDGVFELPLSERQFVRGIEGVAWRHRIDLRLT